MTALPQSVIGVGIDLVDLARLRAANHPDRIADYILTPEEREALSNSRDRIQFLGSRLALKEAVIKAAPEALTLQDVILGKEGERPCVRRAGHDDVSYRVSLSHTADHAVAVAIAFAPRP